MQRIYVHENIIKDAINEAGKEYSNNTKYGKAGEMKNPEKYKVYKDFYDNKYLIMRNKIEQMEFDVDDEESFSECASVLNDYWNELKEFMKENNISKNSKIHTNFLEEFSCYFLLKIPGFEDFDIFVSDVFAGLKIKPDHTIAQIKKNVDFCIGRELTASFSEQDDLVLKIPTISVEVKSFVDATMLGEVMNTSRKIKGANPGSKSILLTWINAFADEHALEAAYDSSIDEIVVLSSHKRKSGEEIIIEFTKEGLRDYYAVILKSMREVMQDSKIPDMGRILSYARNVISD